MTRNPLTSRVVQRNALILYLGWAIAFSLTFFYILNFNWYIALADSLMTGSLLLLGCIVVSTVMRYYKPADDALFFVLIISCFLSGLIVFICNFLLGYIFLGYDSYLDFLKLTTLFRAVVLFVFLAWCTFSIMLWYRLEEQSEMQQRLFTTQNLAKEAELSKLRHQLQPHFLFNSLNSVYALTIVNPKEAGLMITKLAAFLRGTLKRDDDVWVTVAEEMEYIQLYLDIEKVRFSHRLNLDIKIDEASTELLLPGTILQPVVENAIKFGLYNTSAPVLIAIHVQVEQQQLRIRVENPYDPELKNAEGTGFGLSAIKRRLYLLFADQTLLKTESLTGNIYRTTLQIPQNYDQNYTH